MRGDRYAVLSSLTIRSLAAWDAGVRSPVGPLSAPAGQSRRPWRHACRRRKAVVSAHPGQGGRPRLRPWRNLLIAQVVKRDEQRWVVETERRIVDGTPARVETLRRRAQGDGAINTAYIARLNATFQERVAALVRRTLTSQHGIGKCPER